MRNHIAGLMFAFFVLMSCSIEKCTVRRKCTVKRKCTVRV